MMQREPWWQARLWEIGTVLVIVSVLAVVMFVIPAPGSAVRERAGEVQQMSDEEIEDMQQRLSECRGRGC
jgi:hypothetical protein